VSNRIVELFVPRGSQVNRGIHQTLQRIAATAEALTPAGDDGGDQSPVST
jgi:hypothetical protein